MGSMRWGACSLQAVQGSRIRIHGFVARLVIPLGSSFAVRLHLCIVGVAEDVDDVNGCSVIWYGSRWDLDWIVHPLSMWSMDCGAPRNGLSSGEGSEWDQILSRMFGIPWEFHPIPGIQLVLDPSGIRILWGILVPCAKIFRIFLAWCRNFSYLCSVIKKQEP